MIGQTISQYKILEKLGEGGMGVVYKAEDTKLDRFVALKFLPANLTSSNDDKARFLQEARAAASLAHPNICTIHSVEEQDGKAFIVMEYVDGKTLKDMHQSLPLNQAIEIGIQIADGLTAAHDKGIVHRDIKPDNIMIRKDGRVQIMDFGLAKLKGGSRLTREGSTVGTAGYMSPEQIQGQEADHRTDIFSLGVVLYELIAGESPFKGVHEIAVAYEIVNVDPRPLSAVKSEIDPQLNAIVLECLEKEPSERYQSVAEVAKDLRRFKRGSGRHVQLHAASRTAAMQSAGPGGVQKTRGRFLSAISLPWMVAFICFVGLAGFAIAFFFSASPEKQTIHAFLPAPEKSNFFMYGNEAGPAAISPDGRRLAFVAVDSSGRRHLYVWALDATSPQRLAGTDGALRPFWSPNSQFIGFFDLSQLKSIDASGGPPTTICDARNARGGTWNKDGTIIFSPGPVDPLFVVPASGGTPTQLTKLETSRGVNSHRWPWFLPDGKHYLYFARTTVSGTQSEGDAICVASLDGKEGKVLVRASSNAQYASGYLLFTRENSLVAQRFDTGSLELKGEAITIAEGVAYDESTIHSLFTASQNGILVYQTGDVQVGSRLIFFDRNGKRLRIIGDRGEYLLPRISADGKRLATDMYSYQSHNIDIWIYDIERNSKTRFTFNPSSEQYPIWSGDGGRIYFNDNPEGVFDLYRKSSTGAGSQELVLHTAEDKLPLDISADGKFLLYQAYGGPRTQSDLWIVPLDGIEQGRDRKPIVFLQTEFNETDGRFSPDSRWIAYTSNESGQNEIYLRTVSPSNGRWQVSTAGGRGPRWRRDGKELYYLSPDNKIMVAAISSNSASVEVSDVHPLLEVPLLVQLVFPGYDVSADGSRFLVNVQSETQNQTPLSLTVNWDAALKKK